MNSSDEDHAGGQRGIVRSAIVRRLPRSGCTYVAKRSSAELNLRNQALTKELFLAAPKVGENVANGTYTVGLIYDNIIIASKRSAVSVEIRGDDLACSYRWNLESVA